MEDQFYRQKYIKYKSKYNGMIHNMTGGAFPNQFNINQLRQQLPTYNEPVKQKAIELGQATKEWINKSKFNIGEKLQTTSGLVTVVQNKIYDFSKGKWSYVITNVEGRLQNIDESDLEKVIHQVREQLPQMQSKIANWKEGLQARIPELHTKTSDIKESIQAKAPGLQSKIQEQLTVLQGRISELSVSLPDKNRIYSELADLKNKLPSLSAEEINIKLIHIHEHLIDLQNQAKSQASIWSEHVVEFKNKLPSIGEVQTRLSEKLSDAQLRQHLSDVKETLSLKSDEMKDIMNRYRQSP